MKDMISPLAVWRGPEPLAWYWLRYRAQLIDTLVVSIGWGIGAVGLLVENVTSMIALLALGVFVLPGVYETAMVARGGQTIGKKAVGVKVVGTDGKPIGWVRSAVRYTFKFIGFVLPPVFLLDIISYVSSLNNQTLHDRAAGTVVVRTDVSDAL